MLRYQFTLLGELPNQSADNWLCSLRDVSRKCDFGQDCCTNCEPTHILGQLIAGVADNAVRITLLEQARRCTHSGPSSYHPTHDRNTPTTSKAINLSTPSGKQHTRPENRMHHRAKKFASHQALRGKIVTDRLLADTLAHHSSQCPAFGKTCDHYCGKENHFAVICESEAKPGASS